MTYTPGDQFYLNHLVSKVEEEPGKIIKNADGGCDLKGVFKEVIGESSISATAVYPYEPVDYPGRRPPKRRSSRRSRPSGKRNGSSSPRVPGANEQSVRIVVAKAQDIDGSPFVGETVCFVRPERRYLSHFPVTEVFDDKDLLGFGKARGTWRPVDDRAP